MLGSFKLVHDQRPARKKKLKQSQPDEDPRFRPSCAHYEEVLSSKRFRFLQGVKFSMLQIFEIGSSHNTSHANRD